MKDIYIKNLNDCIGFVKAVTSEQYINFISRYKYLARDRGKRSERIKEYISAEGTLTEMKRAGEWLFYSMNKDLKVVLTRKGSYYGGMRVGLWKFFHLNGKISQRIYFFYHPRIEFYVSDKFYGYLFIDGVGKTYKEVERWKKNTMAIQPHLDSINEVITMSKLYALNPDSRKY